jgi:hypothetical protein
LIGPAETRGTASFHTSRLKLQNPQTNQPPSISEKICGRSSARAPSPFRATPPSFPGTLRVAFSSSKQSSEINRHGHGRFHLHRVPQGQRRSYLHAHSTIDSIKNSMECVLL